MTHIFDLTQVFGRVQMTGATRLAFLHRMSTGDVLALKQGQGRPTALTTPIGRMVDYTPALALDDAVILLTGGGNAARVVQWLRSYVLYNDEVKIHDISAATQMVGAFGAGADDWVAQLDPVAYAQLQQAPVYAHMQQGNRLWVKALPLDGAGYYLMGVGVRAALPAQLQAQIRPTAAYDALRIAHGQPAFPGEIGEGYIPLEAGLWEGVSFSKGCYIGQEIIARMESRNQIAKKLVQVEILGEGDSVRSTNIVDGAVVAVTSRSDPYALAYVRGAAANAGQMLRLQDGLTVAIVRRVI